MILEKKVWGQFIEMKELMGRMAYSTCEVERTDLYNKYLNILLTVPDKVTNAFNKMNVSYYTSLRK